MAGESQRHAALQPRRDRDGIGNALVRGRGIRCGRREHRLGTSRDAHGDFILLGTLGAQRTSAGSSREQIGSGPQAAAKGHVGGCRKGGNASRRGACWLAGTQRAKMSIPFLHGAALACRKPHRGHCKFAITGALGCAGDSALWISPTWCH